MRLMTSLLIGLITLLISILLSFILIKMGYPVFFVTLFLPFIGLPIFKYQTEEKLIRINKCPACGWDLEGWEKYCPNCGERLNYL